MIPWSGRGDCIARPLRHAIHIIKSAYSALFATAQLSRFELSAVRCLRQYSRESKSKKYQPKNRFWFNSIFKKKLDFDLRFNNRNITKQMSCSFHTDHTVIWQGRATHHSLCLLDGFDTVMCWWRNFAYSQFFIVNMVYTSLLCCRYWMVNRTVVNFWSLAGPTGIWLVENSCQKEVNVVCDLRVSWCLNLYPCNTPIERPHATSY